MNTKQNITIFGAGYVGMSLAVLLAENNTVRIFDIDKKKIDLINGGASTIKDSKIDEVLANKNIIIHASDNSKDVINHSGYYIIATPTDYDPNTGNFDTSSVESSIKLIIDADLDPVIIIKSTIPIGFTDRMKIKFNYEKIIFSPEFLREGSALEDNLNPSRLIIGGMCEYSEVFANLLVSSANKEEVPILYMDSKSAESVKLFANAYLAMRVAFFNELDSFALSNNIESRNLIDGICLDDRIGDNYNNPSFGYGGYCLPKDTKQLLSSFEGIPQNLISAIIKSNDTRKKYIASEILKFNPYVVGIYRLNMKFGSDNFRLSAIIDIIQILLDNKKNIIIYEPCLDDLSFMNVPLEKSLEAFKDKSSLILANRITDDLLDVEEKIFSRDLFNEN